MPEMFLEYWPILVAALVVGLVTGWWVWGRRRRIDIARPSLDDLPPAPTLQRAPAVAPTAPPVAVTNNELLLIKGLGPKAASLLAAQGVSTLAEIAAWSDADVRAIDAHLGNFAGRPTRDQWVAQAQLLTAGDRAAYEARFGKLDAFPPQPQL